MKNSGFTWVLTVYAEDGKNTGVQYRFNNQYSCVKQMEREFAHGRSVHIARSYWKNDDEPFFVEEDE